MNRIRVAGSLFWIALLFLGGCIKQVEPTDRFQGVYDCRTNFSERNISGGKTSQTSDLVMVISMVKLTKNTLQIQMEGRQDLTVEAEIINGRLAIRRQDISVRGPNGFLGVMTVVGEGTLTDRWLTLSYLASAGPDRYTLAIEASGLRR